MVLWVRRNGLEIPAGSIALATLRADWLDPHLVVTVGAGRVA